MASNWLISAGLEPVLCHTEKLCLASYNMIKNTKFQRDFQNHYRQTDGSVSYEVDDQW